MTVQKAEHTPGPSVQFIEKLSRTFFEAAYAGAGDQVRADWSEATQSAEEAKEIIRAGVRAVLIAAAPETAAERDRLQETVEILIIALMDIESSNNSKRQSDLARAAMAFVKNAVMKP
jgi:hypothetical protein